MKAMKRPNQRDLKMSVGAFTNTLCGSSSSSQAENKIHSSCTSLNQASKLYIYISRQLNESSHQDEQWLHVEIEVLLSPHGQVSVGPAWLLLEAMVPSPIRDYLLLASKVLSVVVHVLSTAACFVSPIQRRSVCGCCYPHRSCKSTARGHNLNAPYVLSKLSDLIYIQVCVCMHRVRIRIPTNGILGSTIHCHFFIISEFEVSVVETV